MYVDLFVLIALLVFVIIYSKRFQTYIFGFAMIDLLFRILNVINSYIPIESVKSFVKNYVPSSIPNIINKYTDDTINIVLIFVYVAIMVIFLYYTIKIFIKRKRIS